MLRLWSAVSISCTFLLLVLPAASITLQIGEDRDEVGIQASGWDLIRGVNVGVLFGREEVRFPSEYWFAFAFFLALISLVCEVPDWKGLVFGLRLVVAVALSMHGVFGFRLESRPYVSASPTPYLWTAGVLAIVSCVLCAAEMWNRKFLRAPIPGA